jgi:hypothetical protein
MIMRNPKLLPLILTAIILSFFNACGKDDDKDKNGTNSGNGNGNATEKVSIRTVSVTRIEQTTALVRGRILEDGGAEITRRGFVWSDASSPTLDDNVIEAGDGMGVFDEPITGLNKNTIYYVRAFAVNSKGTHYGSNLGFSTLGDPVIGQLGPGGGYIFYLDGNGNGLVAAPANSEFKAKKWGCNGEQVGGTQDNIGSGHDNTTAIVNNCPEDDIAAKVCLDLDINGYDDWYLPSKDELGRVYINLKDKGIGGFGNGKYWTSTEIDSDNAMYASFVTGGFPAGSKNDTLSVRAVRSFEY